jgi:hypothetical protein
VNCREAKGHDRVVEANLKSADEAKEAGEAQRCRDMLKVI